MTIGLSLGFNYDKHNWKHNNQNLNAIPYAVWVIVLKKILPSYLYFKAHQILKLHCSSSRLAVIFAQSIGARC